MDLLIDWIQTNFSELVEDMRKSTHHYNYKHLNNFHMEGDIWTHTLMVYNEARRLTSNHNVLLAALLHDIGKPRSRSTFIKYPTMKFYEVNEKQIVPLYSSTNISTFESIRTHRTGFFNHENISTYMSIPLLLDLKKRHPDFEFDLKQVLLLINWHSDFHNIGKILDSGEFILRKKDKIKLNNRYGYRFEYLNDRYSNELSSLTRAIKDDLELFHNMIDLNEADNRGRILKYDNDENNQKKFDFLRKFVPINNNKKVNYENDERPEFIILSGTPCSGKSTFTKKLLQEKEYIYISSDDLINSKFPNLTAEEFVEKLRDEELTIEIDTEMRETIQKAIIKKKNIIFDRTNLSLKSRRRWSADIHKKHNYFKRSINFLISEELSNKRNQTRFNTNKYIPEERLLYMLKKYVLTGEDEVEIVEYVLADLE